MLYFLKNNEKHLEISSFYTCLPKNLELVVLGHFLPFYPTKNPKNQSFEKMKIIAGDIIILEMCTKNHNHMMYSS